MFSSPHSLLAILCAQVRDFAEKNLIYKFDGDIAIPPVTCRKLFLT